MSDLKYYSALFAHLNTANRLGRPAPHKAILLLSVIDLIEKGIICSPQIPLSDELITTFHDNWKRYLGALQLFRPDIGKPFFHMQHEPFWCLRDKEEAYTAMASDFTPTLTNAQKKELPIGNYSTKSLRSTFYCAEIDNDLFHLLRNQKARGHLRVVLISTYLQNQSFGTGRFPSLSIMSAILYALAG